MSVEDLVSAIAALPAPDRQRAYAELDALRGAEPGGDGPASDRPPVARPASADEPSAHDRARHLAGSAPGPADLSSNPDHLRGFGERRPAPRP